MGRMTYAVYGYDGAAGSPAHYSSPYGFTKLVLNLPTPKGWKDEASSRVPRPGVEPGPLASEASVLPLDHYTIVYNRWSLCDIESFK